MLKKIYRLRKKKDFEEIKTKGVLYHSPLFSLVVIKSNDDTKQFGIIVSKKIDKSAVVRNRIRRLITISVKNSWEKFGNNIKCVFLVRKAILNKSLKEIEEEVVKICEEIR